MSSPLRVRWGKRDRNMSGNDKTISVWLNPLILSSIGELPFWPDNQPIELSLLVKDLSLDFGSEFLENIRKRYWLLTTPEFNIPVVPNEKKILEKLVWPLRKAKQAFFLNDCLGCIALCGMVCEMAIIFLFDLATINVNGKPLSPEREKQMFGREFEELGQKRRIDVLCVYGLLNKKLASDANKVRKIRNEYLHSLRKDYSKIDKDSEDAYKASFRLIKSLVDLPIGEGKIVIPSTLR